MEEEQGIQARTEPALWVPGRIPETAMPKATPGLMLGLGESQGAG